MAVENTSPRRPAKRTFTYLAVDQRGARHSDRIEALDRASAVRKLAADGLTVVKLEEQRATAFDRLARRGRRSSNLTERALILRQLAIMSAAGVDQLDAVETAARGVESSEAKRGLAAVAAGLRRGDALAEALRAAMPQFPGYVYALIRVGEASGRLDAVLTDAAAQLAVEERLRKDVANALTYPAFLFIAGVIAITFLFYEVVPRFAAMAGPDANLPWLSALVIDTGLFVRANPAIILGAIAGAILGAAALLANPQARAALLAVAARMPVIGEFLLARERSVWARTMFFALSNGVSLLDSVSLAREGLPPGRFRRVVEESARALKSGRSIHDVFNEQNALSQLDLSLLRSGQKSGALAPVFGFIATRYEDAVRDSLKRMTALIEPISIVLIAGFIGLIAVALVTSMSSIYETIG